MSLLSYLGMDNKGEVSEDISRRENDVGEWEELAPHNGVSKMQSS